MDEFEQDLVVPEVALPEEEKVEAAPEAPEEVKEEVVE